MPVLFILAVLWAVVLLPPLLRSRSQRSADSIGDFNYKLDVLGRTNGSLDGGRADNEPVDGGRHGAGDPGGILAARMAPNPLPVALSESAHTRKEPAIRRQE